MTWDSAEERRASPGTIDELFDLVRSIRTTRDRAAQLEPQIGLWITVEGNVEDIADDAGSDGEGGQWTSARIDLRKNKVGYPKAVLQRPRPVRMYFLKADAKAIRALAVGDYVKATGRIGVLDSIVGVKLVPAELISYRKAESPTRQHQAG